jgi:hypothetical protein
VNERRRAVRIDVEIPARILLAGGRRAEVTISNVGEMGALVSLTDLEVSVHEGERALLVHPRLVDGRAQADIVRTAAAVVRVELDLAGAAVLRQVALHFDGGPAPAA